MEALNSIIKTVLIIMLVYFGLKFLFRWLGPIVLRYFLKKVGRKFEQQFRQQASGTREKKKESTIKKKPTGKRRSNKKVGEYIDYEEID